MPKCKNCKCNTDKKYGLNYLCGPECGYEYSKKITDKRRMKEKSEARKTDREKLKALKTRSEWLKECQSIFNRFIRLRDAGLPCVSCGRFHEGQWHAGHYLSVGAHPELRFNEMNVWRQCQPCNAHLSGNQINYRKELVRRIGLEEVEKLESKHEPLKLTVDEIKELIKTYKAKVKALTGRTC